MDNQQIKKILIPAAAIAGVILLVGIIIATGGSPDPGKPGDRGVPTGDPGSITTGKFSVFPLEGPEWKELPGGVKYWDVVEGSGSPVPQGATVTMHYTLWLTNGKKVQSSKDSAQPFTSSLFSLIKGWQEAIPGMKPGGTRRLVIPPEKGYGSQNKTGIPADSTLIFEVDLISSP